MIKNPGIEHCEIHYERFGDEEDSISRHIELGWNAAFEWLEGQGNMLNALAECEVYNSVGGLNDAVLEDIAHDHGVTIEELSKQWCDDE